MKTSFSRFLLLGAIVLLTMLLIIGFSFQVLARDVLDKQTVEGLKNDCDTISSLASAYYFEGALSTHDFLINLSVASQVSGADAVICNVAGQLALCSDSPLGCEHQGMVIQNQEFLHQVLSTGCVTSTGFVPGLYPESRYVVAMPIADAAGHAVGIVIVSTPMTQARLVMKRISNIYFSVLMNH